MSECRACGANAHTLHPAPHPSCSVVSDGRVVLRRLARRSCTVCGLASYADPLPGETIRRFYDGSYDLGAQPGRAEVARATAHAALIAEARGPGGVPGSLLEVGCGAGLVLDELVARWPNCRAIGLEAAARLAARTSRHASVIHQGFFEDLPEDAAGFDLIYAINVIEHAADPIVFLQGAAKRLDRAGRVVLMAPRADPPNLELLFADHIHTFTPSAMAWLARKADLSLVRNHTPSSPIGDFSVYVLSRTDSSGSEAPPPTREAAELAAARGIYLAAWQSLDSALAARLPTEGRVAAFGAGEASALLRAYAPRTWARIDTLLVDESFAARGLDKPVERYDPAAAYPPLLLAVHPRAQLGLAERLTADGQVAIAWNDLISR